MQCLIGILAAGCLKERGTHCKAVDELAIAASKIIGVVWLIRGALVLFYSWLGDDP